MNGFGKESPEGLVATIHLEMRIHPLRWVPEQREQPNRWHEVKNPAWDLLVGRCFRTVSRVLAISRTATRTCKGVHKFESGLL